MAVVQSTEVEEREHEVATPTESSVATSELAEDTLVEEISIDGMCGVY